jgi:hypothetical protein
MPNVFKTATKESYSVQQRLHKRKKQQAKRNFRETANNLAVNIDADGAYTTTSVGKQRTKSRNAAQAQRRIAQASKKAVKESWAVNLKPL